METTRRADVKLAVPLHFSSKPHVEGDFCCMAAKDIFFPAWRIPRWRAPIGRKKAQM